MNVLFFRGRPGAFSVGSSSLINRKILLVTRQDLVYYRNAPMDTGLHFFYEPSEGKISFPIPFVGDSPLYGVFGWEMIKIIYS